MTIKKGKDNLWLVDVYPQGRSGKRVRKKFKTRIEGQRFEKYVLNKAHEDKDWNDSKKDSRKLLNLIELWYSSKGVHLKDGVRRRDRLNVIAEWLGNPVAKDVKPADFLKYSAMCKADGLSEKTINNHQGYLNAVYNYLYSIEEVDYSNPLAKVQMIKIDERELSWLTSDQITLLLDTIEGFSKNPHVLLLTKLCLATGARWGEVESLKKRHLQGGKITFTQTKSGKSRSVPIEARLFEELSKHLSEWGEFTNSLGAFRRALKASCIELPKGQAAHVLRHSFASHFMMNGGNILTLQKIMGHSTINMTMRYAHLSPDHLLDALKLNPLAIQKG